VGIDVSEDSVTLISEDPQIPDVQVGWIIVLYLGGKELFCSVFFKDITL
jgi:hypothetical protein